MRRETEGIICSVTPEPYSDNDSYWLGLHLSYFLGVARATEADICAALIDFSSQFPDSPFLTFLLGEGKWNNSSILINLDVNKHLLHSNGPSNGPARWPTIEAWDSVPVTDSLELHFSAEMAYFLGATNKEDGQPWRRGSWENVLQALSSYAAAYKRDLPVPEGCVFVDVCLRSLFGLIPPDGGCAMTFSDFRRQMLARGHLKVLVPQPATDEAEDMDTSSESDEMPPLIPEPTSVKQALALVEDLLARNRVWMTANPQPAPPAESLPVTEVPTISFAGITFQAEEEVTEAEKPRNPLEEVHTLICRVEVELEDPDVKDGVKCWLLRDVVAFCSKQVWAAAWRASTFERLLIRSTFRAWIEMPFAACEPELVAAVEEFLAAFPV